MKKTAFLIGIALVLSGCTPQVTVTSEVTVTLTPTPIPTPTLHPDFIALQESIAASGERFTLHADGLLYDGETPIPGVTVAPNGMMTITVDGETVTLDPADVDFDDEKGITIDGYEFDHEIGAWVEVISAAMQTATGLVEQYGIDPESVTITEEGGAVNVTDNETGTVLIRTIGEQSKFDLGFAVDGIAAKSCEPTDFKPSRGGLLLAEYSQVFGEYRDALLKYFDYKYQNGGPSLLDILIDREKQCWGITDGRDLFFRDKDGMPHKLPLIALTKAEIREFQASR